MRRVSVVMMLVAVSLAVASAAAAGGGGGCHGATGDAEGLAVRMEGSCFTPQVIRARAGDAITFSNLDPYPHTVTGAGLEWGSSDMIAGGGSVTARFDRPGIYPYMCNLHPGMVGAVVVGDVAAAGGEASAVIGARFSATPFVVLAAAAGAAFAGLGAAIAVFRARRRSAVTG